MTSQKQAEPIWVVVKVESGIPVIVEAYSDQRHAEMRERLLRKAMRPENDETGVFQIQVHSATPPALMKPTAK